MSDPAKQQFIAYRQTADNVVIRFVGGPLDGAVVKTDEQPNGSVFVHQLGRRDYNYRYRKVSRREFDAEFCGPATGRSGPPLKEEFAEKVGCMTKRSGWRAGAAYLLLISVLLFTAVWAVYYCQA